MSSVLSVLTCSVCLSVCFPTWMVSVWLGDWSWWVLSKGYVWADRVWAMFTG